MIKLFYEMGRFLKKMRFGSILISSLYDGDQRNEISLLPVIQMGVCQRNPHQNNRDKMIGVEMKEATCLL